MKSLVIYDSNFGNTKRIAEAIGSQLPEATVIDVDEVSDTDLHEVALLVVGSPINGFRPTPDIINYLESLKPDRLQGVAAASFDSRVKFFFTGDAAKKISRLLKQAGAHIIAEPRAFYVKDKEGPLFETEIDSAMHWANELHSALVNEPSLA